MAIAGHKTVVYFKGSICMTPNSLLGKYALPIADFSDGPIMKLIFTAKLRMKLELHSPELHHLRRVTYFDNCLNNSYSPGSCLGTQRRNLCYHLGDVNYITFINLQKTLYIELPPTTMNSTFTRTTYKSNLPLCASIFRKMNFTSPSIHK